MLLCSMERCDVLIDGKPYKLENTRQYAYIRGIVEKGYKAISFRDERATLSRLLNQAQEKKLHVPARVRERMRILQQMPTTPIHGE